MQPPTGYPLVVFSLLTNTGDPADAEVVQVYVGISSADTPFTETVSVLE